MRTLAVAAITSLIALAVASVASAAPSVSFVWTDCVGPGCGAGIGTNSITADVGDVLTLQLLVTPDANNATYAGLSFDVSSGGTVLAYTRPGLDSINDDLANVWTTQGPDLLLQTAATYTGAGLEFVPGSGVTCPAGTGNLAAGICGLSPFMTAGQVGSDLGSGIIGSFGTNPIASPGVGNQFTLAQAQFSVVPEPATGGLLALGLGALALIGRRRA